MSTFRLTIAVASALAFAEPVVSQEIRQEPSIAAAFAAAKEGDWGAAYALAPQGDTLTRDLLTWTRLREEENEATFDDYLAFTARRADWPGMDRLRMRGEERIPAGLPPETVIGWFGDTLPETGEGAVRLAEALIASGQRDRAVAALTDSWLKDSLTEKGHAAMMAAFPDVLASHHAARTDAMLWRWKTDDARRMLPLLSPDHRALAEARIALLTKASDAEAKVAVVPAAMRDDPGLAVDRFNWLADRGDRAGAIALLKSRNDSAARLGQPFRWSGWRRSLARFEMREGNYQSAYELASKHFMTPEDGDSYADLEWLAGYVSLRFLNAPERALTHFRATDNAVEGPISLSRAAYWIARTHEAMGNPDAARTDYQRAAQYQTAFYGQLAAEKLGLPLDPSLVGDEAFPAWEEADFLGADMTRAALTLLTAGERVSAVLFFAKLGETLDRTQLGQLGEIATELDEPFYAILLGKSGVKRGIMIPELYFPMHRLAHKDLPVPTELAMAIARRESEFREDAGSAVGALGLMQLMPGTAEEVAGELGLPYSRGRLTSDWEYNATLGAKYLRNLQDRFGPSPVFIAAGYNAGPSRPFEWIGDRGDPRLGEIDVIDWIELIPFRETRNYVQRVSEAVPIYRARLSGQGGRIALTRELIGEKPIIRPMARPGSAATATAPATAATAAPVTSISSRDTSPRPVARPKGLGG